MDKVPEPYSAKYEPGGGTGCYVIEGPGNILGSTLRVTFDSRKEQKANELASLLNIAFRNGWYDREDRK